MRRVNFRLCGIRAVLPVAVISIFITAFLLIATGTVSTEPGIESAFAKEKSQKDRKKSKRHQKGEDGKDESSDSKTKSKTKKFSEDELYVQDMLEEYLHPTKIKFLKDGRVQMQFEFSKKDPDHEEIFTRRVSTKINSTLRWSVRREERYYNYGRYGGGLRISDAGIALLNCWFDDVVEAEIVYGTGTSFTESQTAALVFCNKKGDSIGSNYGTQCAQYRKIRPVKRKGTPRSLSNRTTARFKLVVKDGEFEAHLNGRKKNEMKYSQKKFASGRIGFVWGGNVAGLVFTLSIKGRIDAPRMAKELRKIMRKRR